MSSRRHPVPIYSVRSAHAAMLAGVGMFVVAAFAAFIPGGAVPGAQARSASVAQNFAPPFAPLAATSAAATRVR